MVCFSFSYFLLFVGLRMLKFFGTELAQTENTAFQSGSSAHLAAQNTVVGTFVARIEKIRSSQQPGSKPQY